MEKYTTNNSKQTQKMGEMLAKELRGGEIICLTGDLGSGKTTFAQGMLKGLEIKGPYTSPTFLVMKQYHITYNIKRKTKNRKMFHVPCSMINNIYHIDAYRVNAKNILDLGWKEIIADPQNIVIIEWAERIRRIIPNPPAGGAVWIKFEWKSENEREIDISSKCKITN